MENLNEDLTLELLPKAFARLSNDVTEIKRLLLERADVKALDFDQWFDLNEICKYLPDKPAKPTVYGWVHSGLIPCHKGGKKLRFLKSEIDNWLKHGKKKTVAEIDQEAETYLKKKGGWHA